MSNEPKETLIESGIPWKLAAILGGVLLLILLLAILLKKKPEKQGEPKEILAPGAADNWPDELTRLPGKTEVRRLSSTKFDARNTNGDTVVYLEGLYIGGEAQLKEVGVRTKGGAKSYRSIGSVPPPHRETANTLFELAVLQTFGEWSR